MGRYGAELICPNDECRAPILVAIGDDLPRECPECGMVIDARDWTVDAEPVYDEELEERYG